MSRILLGVLLGLAPSAVLASDASIGVDAGVAIDCADRVSGDYAGFKPGPTLGIGFRYQLTSLTRARATLRGAFEQGTDRITWNRTIDGEEVRFYDDDHFTMLVGVGLTAGLDVMVPGDLPVTPYLGGSVGGVWVGTYHSLGGDTQILLDPTQNDLDSESNIDPYTSQMAFISELRLGVQREFGDTVALWFETGYSVAFLGARPLKKTPVELDARREPYGWNSIRLGLGVSFSL